MGSSGDDHELLVAFYGAFSDDMLSGHALKGILAEIAAVGLLAVDEKHGRLNLSGPGQQGLVQETLAADHVPAIIGIAAAHMITARSLIVGVIVLDEPGGILGERIDDTTGTLISSRGIILRALGRQGAALFLTLGRSVFTGEITLDIHLAHVIHRGCDGSFDAGVQGSSIDGHAAKTADADDADALRIHQVTVGQEIDGRQEILRIDVRGGHPARFATGFAGERRIKGDSQEASFCHLLGIKAAGLLLHGTEGAAHRNRGQFAVSILRYIHICRQLNAIAVMEGNLAVVHQFGFREGLVPLLGQIQCAHMLVCV